MDYKKGSNDSKERVDEQVSADHYGLLMDSKAQELIKLDYDIAIIVDDSESMNQGTPITRWQECDHAIGRIAPLALLLDTGGIEVYFLNNSATKTCKTKEEVSKLFGSVGKLGLATPTGAKLEQVLHPYWEQLKRSHRLFRAPVNPPKRLLIVIITDGAATDDPKAVIIKYARNLQRARWPPRQLAISFVQVGDSEKATEALTDMDNNLKKIVGRDIVDHTIYDPNAASGSHEDENTLEFKILKALIGPIDDEEDKKSAGCILKKRLRALPPSYQRATSPHQN